MRSEGINPLKSLKYKNLRKLVAKKQKQIRTSGLQPCHEYGYTVDTIAIQMSFLVVGFLAPYQHQSARAES